MILEEQLIANSNKTTMRVVIHQPQEVVEETVIQEENTDPTPE